VLWVPAVSVAGDSSPSPSKVTGKAEAPDAKSGVGNPASTCQSQRSERNGRGAANAFGKCVSTIAKHKDKSHREDSDKDQRKEGTGPAMICKAKQAKALAHFQARYGTRPDAFGKCVAERANSKKS
jgi:hypothetical protein